MKYIICCLLILPIMTVAQKNAAPIAKKIEHKLNTHQHTRIDPYYWMNKRDSKDVLAYIKQENNVSKQFFDSNKQLVTNLLDEFHQRINPNDIFPPFEFNGITYQTSYTEGEDYVKTHIIKGKEHILFLDENQRAKKHKFYELADWEPSPNNQLVALAEDFKGRRNYVISFRNYASDEFLKDQLNDTDGTFAWANDNTTIFYIKKDKQTLRSFQVYRHVLGTPQSSDQLIYEEKDERFEVGIEKSANDQYILIYSNSSTTSEVSLIDANHPKNALQLFLAREQEHEYAVLPSEKGFYILTNKNAKNKQIVFSPTIPSSIEACEIILAHNEERILQNVENNHSHLFIEERYQGLEQIRLYDIASKTSELVAIEGETYTLSLASNTNYQANYVNYQYNSLTTPTSIYQLDLKSFKTKLTYQYELLDKTFSPANYESKRIWATAKDGTKIPISIVYKKGIDLASAPCFLYGYGSYGFTYPDNFSATRLSLLNRGFVFAIAHVRGESYLGEQWYQDGKFLKKRNTFTDFIAAGEHLGNERYCDASKIYTNGGSAGGLLMGAIINEAPQLFKGVIADVPFVDVVTTMLDESIPLTVGEYEEWGNPNDKEYYEYMLSYSPYDNIKKMDYPHLLITTGYHDSQVQYWEPLKWIAKLRDYRTNDNLLLLETNMDAGHGGGSGRSNTRLEIAKMYAFILSIEKMD